MVRMTVCDFNDSIFQNEDENGGISIGSKIFGLIMYLIGCLGIFSIFGIITRNLLLLWPCVFAHLLPWLDTLYKHTQICYKQTNITFLY